MGVDWYALTPWLPLSLSVLMLLGIVVVWSYYLWTWRNDA